MTPARTLCQNLLKHVEALSEQIAVGFVPVVDASEITDAIDERCTHADVDGALAA